MWVSSASSLPGPHEATRDGPHTSGTDTPAPRSGSRPTPLGGTHSLDVRGPHNLGEATVLAVAERAGATAVVDDRCAHSVGRSRGVRVVRTRPVAISRARTVYEKEGRHAAPIGALTGHWGFKSPTTGPASVTYAALLKFGLLEDEGTGSDRLAKLTDLAFDILRKPAPEAAIRVAALLPPIHAELWKEFGLNLPSDESLRYRLVGQRGFTETGFREFIREYRETNSFAQMGSGVTAAEDDAAELNPPEATTLQIGEPGGGAVTRATPQAGGPKSASVSLVLPIPLVGGYAVTVQGGFPMSEAAWLHFMAVLEALKPGLVIAVRDDVDGEK